MKVLCKSNFLDMFIAGENYDSIKIYQQHVRFPDQHEQLYYCIKVFSTNGNHHNKFHVFSYYNFLETFYTEKEIRKIKLQKINGFNEG